MFRAKFRQISGKICFISFLQISVKFRQELDGIHSLFEVFRVDPLPAVVESAGINTLLVSLREECKQEPNDQLSKAIIRHDMIENKHGSKFILRWAVTEGVIDEGGKYVERLTARLKSSKAALLVEIEAEYLLLGPICSTGPFPVEQRRHKGAPFITHHIGELF